MTEISISFGGTMFAIFFKFTEQEAQPMMRLLFLLENERVFSKCLFILFICKLSAGSFCSVSPIASPPRPFIMV